MDNKERVKVMAETHFFPPNQVHYRWDEKQTPVLRIRSGDTVIFDTRDAADNQFNIQSTTEDIGNFDWNKVYPLAGPVFMEEAEPGDTLEIEIVDLKPGDWGWTAVLPELGLLPEEFPIPYLKTFDLSNGRTIRFNDRINLPIEPFLGTMGVCPKGAEQQSVMPPGLFGGNLDTRQLTTGSKLYLPVQVAGALFSCGDGHAAQGDGEVCVSALECPMNATLKFRLLKDKKIPSPQFVTTGPLTPMVSMQGFYGTTGIGPDLMEASRDAVRGMVEHISTTYSIEPVEAYLLSSLCVDLKISEIVDAGQYVVSALLPQSIFE